MPSCGAFVSAFFMSASVRVEGKLFELSGEKGVVFPFRVSEVTKRSVSAINLHLDEFRCWQEKWFIAVLQRESLCG